MTWPLASVFPFAVITDGGDGPMFVWNISNFASSIRNHINPFFTNRILWPVGAGLVMHTYTPICGLFGLTEYNPVLVLNMCVFASFVLSGSGAFLLCRYYVKNFWLSLFSGFVFAFCPYKLSHLFEHYNLILTAAIPFFILFFLKAFENSGEKRLPSVEKPVYLVLASLCFLITLLSSYYYSLFLLLFTLLYLIYHRFGLEKFSIPVKRAALIALLSALVSTAFVFILNFAGIPSKGRGAAADLLSYFVPSSFSRLYDFDIIRKLHFDLFLVNHIENTAFAGFTVLAVLAGSLWFISKYADIRKILFENRFLLFIMLSFFLLATPQVYVAGRIVCALPTVLWHYIPFLNNFHVPSRYTLMIMLFLPIFLSRLLERGIFPHINARLRPVIGVSLLLLSLGEYIQKPFPVMSVDNIPPVYHCLAWREEGVLLEIPSGVCSGLRETGKEVRAQMLYQLIHKKTIIGGSVSRIPGPTFDFFSQAPVISDLFSMLENPGMTIKKPDQKSVDRFFSLFNVKYVLIHPEYRGTGVEKYIDTVILPHAQEDKTVYGYRLVTVKP